MRLDISIVGKNADNILAALEETISEIRRSNDSNCVGGVGDITVDYQFTDCDDVYEDNSEAKVIRPFPVRKR